MSTKIVGQSMSSKMRVVFNAFAWVALALVAGEPVVKAEQLDWRDKVYDYAVLNQSVADILTNFGYNTGLRMAIAPSVRGVVNGRIEGKTAGAFLDNLTRENALDWYYDGSVMYVSAFSDRKTEMVPLHGTHLSDIKSQLSASHFVDQRYTLAPNGASDVAVVAGPPSYVAVVKRAIEASAGGEVQSLTIYRGSQPQIVKFP